MLSFFSLRKVSRVFADFQVFHLPERMQRENVGKNPCPPVVLAPETFVKTLLHSFSGDIKLCA